MFDIKTLCNNKFEELVNAIENRIDLKTIHSLILDVAGLLVEISKNDRMNFVQCQKKALWLINIAKSITASSSHEEIYRTLLGKELPIDEDMEIAKKMQLELDNLLKEDAKDDNQNSFEIDLEEDESIQENVLPDMEKDIRPEKLDDYIGQEKAKKLLTEAIEAAKIKGTALDHILIFGSAGLGKTSLSKIVAKEMNARIKVLNGPSLDTVKNVVDVVKDVKEGDILFIDEIHRINTVAAEAIYTAMEDCKISYIDKKGKNIEQILPSFTIIGATTHSGLLEKPMRDRFLIQFKLDLYKHDELAIIATNTMSRLSVKNKKEIKIDEAAAMAIAIRSRGVPRICNKFTKRLYDRALVKGIDCITDEFAEDYFKDACIDKNGLEESDIKYLLTIYDKFGDKAVGLDSLSKCLGEGKNIIENQTEPYLLFLGMIQVTSTGRILTKAGVEYVEQFKAEHRED